MSNNWIHKTQEEQRAEALKTLKRAKELEFLKQIKQKENDKARNN
jgi:hypothetical protein